MESLEKRREKISLKFANRALKSDKFKHWFSENAVCKPKIKTRNNKQELKLKPVTYLRTRYKNSPLSYLTELINNQ